MNSVVKLLKSTLLSSLILLLSQVAHAANQNPANVVIFGDSITSAGGYPFGNPIRPQYLFGAINASPPDRELSRILNDSSRPAVVPNWGFGGSPSGVGPGNLGAGVNGVERISSNLAQSRSRYPSSQYIVLIMYGTNDLGYGLSSPDTGFNIRTMISRARAQGYVPVIATLTPRNDQSLIYRNDRITNAARVLSNPPAPVVDMYNRFYPAGGTLFDNVHPTDASYTVIANIWFQDYLRQAIAPESEPEPESVVIAPIIMLLLDEEEDD